MSVPGRLVLVLGTLLLSGAASQAHAQTAPTRSLSGLSVKTDAARAEALAPAARFGAQEPGRSLRVDSSRWGLQLDLDKPVGREVKPRNVEAGAYYRITPSLRVGGALALDEATEAVRRPTEPQPRVRLGTAFQF